MVSDIIRNVADTTVDKIIAKKKIVIMPYGFNSQRCKIKICVSKISWKLMWREIEGGARKH